MTIRNEATADPSERPEHILVGLSSAPSNAKIVQTAAKMARAFHASFTALYIQTPSSEGMSEQDKKRLQGNVRLAEESGAAVATVCGDDVPFQLAEYARLSGVTKIVMGRTTAKRKIFFGTPTLTDRLIALAPDIDIYIIPDGTADLNEQKKRLFERKPLLSTLKDLAVSIAILALTSVIGFLFSRLGFTEANIITVYILGVLVTSVATNSKLCWGFSSVASVLVFNFLFTTPKFTLLAYDKGYPVTFLVMLIASLIAGSLAAKMKDQAKQVSKAAYRTKILLDSNRLLQGAKTQSEILDVTAKQLEKLLQRNIVICSAEKDKLAKENAYCVSPDESFSLSEQERELALWVFQANKPSDLSSLAPLSRCAFFPIGTGEKVYGTIGVRVDERSIDSFENSLLLSIVGECTLALESNYNAKEKESAAILAENEQLRANLLRAISHDLRTPLTAISGNANNLMASGETLDEETKRQMYADIYDDSLWLIDLVENLLSVTRLEEGKMNLNPTAELVDEVVAEALKHVHGKKDEHTITVCHEDEWLLAKMDARLIVQVIVNLVDNAIKYTPPGSEITIETKRQGDKAVIRIADNGNGIPDEAKPHVFDLFYTGANAVADSRRSLGLGLALCKSILHVHGGTIALSDNSPKGAVFTFTLPISEVTIHE